ncbi:MAG: hypothetical protein KKE86_05380 [Planctomycetes bacterium]|nr:hypothetical protein [Planctomycetota bacterium]MBU4398752.1 hypothetical protein [Planctomycetota bacterium]MCG2685231.1 hypothetical protein [Planctomycetales bacterium]
MPDSIFSIVEQVGIVELQWHSIPMDREYDEFVKKYYESPLNSPGNIVYAFEGKHHAYPTRTVLYIGMSESQGGTRPQKSAKDRIYGKPKIMAFTYSEMVLRWAMTPEISEDEIMKWDNPAHQTPTRIFEHMLIHAMKPVLNSRGADGYMQELMCNKKLQKTPCIGKLVVCNKGDKGLLLPVIYGDYYGRRDEWE